jgi:hypothetical protein
VVVAEVRARGGVEAGFLGGRGALIGLVRRLALGLLVELLVGDQDWLLAFILGTLRPPTNTGTA